MKYISKNEQDTHQIAANLANHLRGGEIIALEGDLGAGKTTFVKAVGKSLGIKKHITSPTFVLMKIYPVSNLQSPVSNLVHVDCYRLDDVQELFYLGLEEYLNKKDTVVIIEWADKIAKYLQRFKKIIKININLHNNVRKITINK